MDVMKLPVAFGRFIMEFKNEQAKQYYDEAFDLSGGSLKIDQALQAIN